MWTEVGDEIMNKKNVVREFIFGVSTIIISLIIVGVLIGLATYKCTHNENYLYYGNKNYYIVTARVGSGRSEEPYDGAISVEDYERWVNGEKGTIYINSVRCKDCGNTLNISNITTINNYGSKPKWLPLNFG